MFKNLHKAFRIDENGKHLFLAATTSEEDAISIADNWVNSYALNGKGELLMANWTVQGPGYINEFGSPLRSYWQ